jgi:FtsP/CotA-like multicopper oxidase with cupredoxin domain
MIVLDVIGARVCELLFSPVHPHPHHDTARQIYMGLMGMMIIDDGSDARLDLPRTYGGDDLRPSSCRIARSIRMDRSDTTTTTWTPWTSRTEPEAILLS